MSPAQPTAPSSAPDMFRTALAELVDIGMSVARMVGRTAEAETALADSASGARAAEGVSPVATSLAEAIEADRAAAAAGEARQAVVARTQAVAASFTTVARAIRRTVLLAERIDQGWARRGIADDRQAMARRQIERGVMDAIGREANGSRAEHLADALAERLDRPEMLDEIALRPAAEIIEAVCRELRVGLARMAPGPREHEAPVASPDGHPPPARVSPKRWPGD